MKKIIVASIVIAIVAAASIFVAVERGVAPENIIEEASHKITYDSGEPGYELLDDALSGALALAEEKVIGKTFSDTTLYKVIDEIRALEYVKSCNAFAYCDNQFILEVTARKVLARYELPAGSAYSDASGYVMFLEGCKLAKSLPLVTFKGECAVYDPVWVAGATSLVLTLMERYPACLSIRCETPTRLLLEFPDLTVVFGDLDGQDVKFARIDTYFADIQPLGKNYKTIDVRYTKQIICK